MTASSDMIKYINRDEGGTHLDLFTNMHHTFKQENPEIYDAQFVADARKMFLDAAALEIEWGKYIIQGGILGLTDEVIEGFIQHLTNRRSAALGLGELFPGVENPVLWFDQFSEPNKGRSNFFEAKPTDYDSSGLEW